MYVIESNADDQKALEQQAEQTAHIIAEYRQAKFANSDAVENLPELVFELLEQDGDNIATYEQTTVLLLKLLSLPEFAALLRRHLLEEEREDISQLLHAFYRFFSSLNCEQHRSFLDLHYVRHHIGELQELKDMEHSYRLLLSVHRLMQHPQE
jgi:hypothetical protein